MAERIPTRDEMKQAILWLARMLVSYSGEPYSEPLQVSIRLPEEEETVSIRPKATGDGMSPPAWFMLGGEEGSGASASELLRVLLSPDEEKLLADLLTHQPCSASSVQDRCKGVLNKSEFWSVWGQLQQRKLVEQREDERYQVAPEWLVRLLKAKREGDGRAA
jgi:hypothetical protein